VLPQIKEQWKPDHYKTEQYRAFVVPFFSSSYTNNGTVFIELKLTTDNLSKVKLASQKYIDSQSGNLKSKIEFYKINLINASRPFNTSVGIFIVLFLLVWSLFLLKVRLKQ
jgi:hypothetical protein